MPSPSADTQLCEETDATAQHSQPSENGSENRGRAGPASPPSAMFDFRFQQKKLLPEEQRPHANLRQPAPGTGHALPSRPVPSCPVPPPRPAPSRSSPRGCAPTGRAAQGLGHWKPSPAPHLQPQRPRSTRHGGCQAPGEDANVPSPRGRLQLCPAKPLQQSCGAGTHGLDVLRDAPGQGGPFLQAKRFPGKTPHLRGLREKIMNEHFINTHVIGRGKQTAIHPGRVQSARHAINKNPSGALSDLWAALGKHAVARRGPSL